jgi:CheY-like chemotaxis protein
LARKILLADDSVTAQNMGRKILTDAGYEVVTVNNGSAALKKIFEVKPDLVVLDVYMPGYSGLEVCQRIKENKDSSRIPILLTVGKLEPFKPEEARRVRADAFVVKPFEASELLAALARLEDKIVPQPEPYKPGRFAKAVAAVDEMAGVDKDESWKARLRIPVAGSKNAEPQPEPEVATTAKAFRDLNEDSSQRAKQAQREPVFAPPLPTGLPVDITPEEIAAITAAAEQLKSSGSSLPVSGAQRTPAPADVNLTTAAPPRDDSSPVTFASAPEAPTPSGGLSLAGGVGTSAQEAQEVAASAPASSEQLQESPSEVAAFSEAAATQDTSPEAVHIVADALQQAPEPSNSATPDVTASVPPAAVTDSIPTQESASALYIPSQESAIAPGMPSPEPSVAPASPVADDEVMAALLSLMPVASNDIPASEVKAVPAESNADPVLAEIVSSVDSSAVRAHVAGPRWVAEEVALAQDEASLSLAREMEQAYAAAAASVEVRAVSAVSIAELAESSSEVPPVDPAPAAPELHSEERPAAAYAMAASGSEVAVRPSVPMAPAEPQIAYESEISGAADAALPVNHLAQSVVEEPPFAPSAESASSPDIDISGGVEDMAAHWKNIRDSIATGGAAKAAPAKEKEEVRPAEAMPEEPAVSPSPSTASSVSDPKAIASIVDSVLAELRPKIVEEIAKKLADSKKD